MLHILVIVATAIGFAVLAVVGGYGWVKWRQFPNRRYQQLMQAQPLRLWGVPDGRQAAD